MYDDYFFIYYAIIEWGFVFQSAKDQQNQRSKDHLCNTPLENHIPYNHFCLSSRTKKQILLQYTYLNLWNIKMRPCILAVFFKSNVINIISFKIRCLTVFNCHIVRTVLMLKNNNQAISFWVSGYRQKSFFSRLNKIIKLKITVNSGNTGIYNTFIQFFDKNIIWIFSVKHNLNYIYFFCVSIILFLSSCWYFSNWYCSSFVLIIILICSIGIPIWRSERIFCTVTSCEDR